MCIISYINYHLFTGGGHFLRNRPGRYHYGVSYSTSYRKAILFRFVFELLFDFHKIFSSAKVAFNV